MAFFHFSDEPCEVGDLTRSGHRVLAITYRVLPSVLIGNYTCRERGWLDLLQPETPRRCLQLGSPQLVLPFSSR